jgi:Uma2 family endonuclease
VATTVLISVAEYLRSSYEPDADFVDGLIEERTVGEREHSDLQRQLLLLLSQPAFQSMFVCNPELRVQVSESRFRLPDLCVLAVDAPYEDVVHTPPMLCIEILSPDDTMARTMVRVDDFLTMGVPEVWVFVPATRTVHVCTADGIAELVGGILTVPNTNAAISIIAAFSVLRPR